MEQIILTEDNGTNYSHRGQWNKLFSQRTMEQIILTEDNGTNYSHRGQWNKLFSQRTMEQIILTEDNGTNYSHRGQWNKLSTDCVNASIVNMFRNKVNKYLRIYTLVKQCLTLDKPIVHLPCGCFACTVVLLNLVSPSTMTAMYEHTLALFQLRPDAAMLAERSRQSAIVRGDLQNAGRHSFRSDQRR